MKLPATLERVIENTPPEVNERIYCQTRYSLEYHQQHPEDIDRRLEQLDREWDIERALEANASSLVLGGSLLGLISSRKFLFLPLAVSGFLLQHALQGWCPPLSLFRRSGYRTASEIDAERYALESIRRGEKIDIGEQLSVYAQQRSAQGEAAASLQQ